MKKIIVALVFLFMLPAVASAADYDDAVALYSQDKNKEALDILVPLLRNHLQNNDRRKIEAAYLINLILEHYLIAQDFEDFVLRNPLDAHYLEGMRELRQGKREKAIGEFALAASCDDAISSCLVYKMLDNFINPDKEAYILYFEKKFEHAINLSLGPSGDLYLLLKDVNKILRLDDSGSILKEIPIQAEYIDLNDAYSCGFAIFSDGKFLVNNRELDKSGKEIFRYNFKYGSDVWVDENGAVYSLHPEGLVKYKRRGNMWEWYRTGCEIQEGKFLPFKYPWGLAVSRDHIYIADTDRIGIFDREGKFQGVFGKEGKKNWDWTANLQDITVDQKGFIYVLSPDGIFVFDPNLDFVHSIKTYANKVIVDKKGRVYAFGNDGNLKVFLPLGKRSEFKEKDSSNQ